MTAESNANQPPIVHIVGGGLAGSEAAWQCLRQGLKVVLHEMRPDKTTEAHKTGGLAELVCSNTFKSLSSGSAPAQLKYEMTKLDSLILRCAHAAAIPAGQALGVDRHIFSDMITETLTSHPWFTRANEEVTSVPTAEELCKRNECWIIATGPLTSAGMIATLQQLARTDDHLYFYDAIAPIIATESILEEHTFKASRYGKGGNDYINLPLSKEQYETLIDDILTAEKMPLHEFEKTPYFECCLPIEVMAERGRETLRFGPLKPVGLTDPKTGHRPWANIQLRRENAAGTMYSLVGFQTKMKWPEQKRVFTKIPALAQAEFYRLGSVHRNTYIESPKALADDLSFLTNQRVFLAGQLTGVEGYTESSAMGLLAGRAAVAKIRSRAWEAPPKDTIIGALADYVCNGGSGDFQPLNANMGLLPPIQKQRGVSKADRREKQCTLAKASFDSYAAAEARL